MKLPSEYLPYAERTAILVCDRAGARVYQAFDREVSAFDAFTNDELPLDDTERYSASLGGDRLSKSQDEGLKERVAKGFYSVLAQRLFDLDKRLDYAQLIVIVPRDDQNTLLDALHTDVRARVALVVPKQLTKISDDALMERLDKERRVQ